MSESIICHNSALGQAWRLVDYAEAKVQQLGQHKDLPEIVRRLLVQRGVDVATLDEFLNPTLRRDLPDPFHLRDMRIAVDRLLQAIEQRETIAVFGDYDVDGATSSAVLKRYFAMLGHPCTVYIPNRLLEGYGPNFPALERLHQQGVKVVITVDCGTLSYEPLEQASALGLDLIVVDHHAAEARLPKILAVINPNRLDEESPHKTLAAVGVSFLLIVALNASLRQRGYFSSTCPEPDILQLLDLVALGTVCDVMPLQGLNRTFVTQGLKVMQQRRTLGLRVLCDQLTLEAPITTYHLGFAIGPRINAGGRVGQSDLGVRLLTTTNETEAQQLCAAMDTLNTQRRAIEQEALAEARTLAEAQHGRACIVLASANWHQGIIGIVAGRLRESFHRPVCIIALEDGMGKGSGRSVPGIDLGALIRRASQENLITQGGGHAMAAGFVLEASQIDTFATFMDTLCREGYDAETSPTVHVDGILSLAAANLETAFIIDKIGPFGAGNPQPIFVIKNVKATQSKAVGRQNAAPEHIRCALIDGDGGPGKIAAIAFRSCNTALEPLLLGSASGSAVIHVAGTLRIQQRGGYSTVQFWIEDAVEAIT